MKEEIVPGHIVIPDQFFDRTQGKRASTFLEQGLLDMFSLPILFVPIFLPSWSSPPGRLEQQFTSAGHMSA